MQFGFGIEPNIVNPFGFKFGIDSEGGASYLPLTTAYAAATGITDPTILSACNELEKNIKALPGASINTTYDFYGDGNINYLYINRGSSEVGCETDFVQNFNATVMNSPTYTADGLVLDGVSDYANTGFIADSEFGDEKCGWAGYYKGVGSGAYAVGAANDPNKYNTLAVVFNPTTSTSELSDAGGTPFAADTAVDGFRGAFRTDASTVIYQILNTASSGARAFGAHPTIQDVRGGLNYNTDGNITSLKAITEVMLFRLNGNIDAAKLLVLKNICNQFVTDLGI